MRKTSFVKMLLCLVVIGLCVAMPQRTQAAAMTNNWENSLIDFLFRGQTYTPPATIYIALFTTCPTDSTSGTEVSGGSYARVAVTSALANWAGTQSAGSTTASSGTGGTTSNNAAVTFPTATADWGTVTCFGGMTASTGGTLLFFANLTTSRSITNGSTASFANGALTFQIDN